MITSNFFLYMIGVQGLVYLQFLKTVVFKKKTRRTKKLYITDLVFKLFFVLKKIKNTENNKFRKR